ncbi:MAG: hypothetical protein HFF84_09165 [Oscillibacter sp.]|nr:hypothetical protein [Oscillibacter sp.]
MKTKRYVYRAFALLLTLCAAFSICASATLLSSDQLYDYEVSVSRMGGGQLKIFFSTRGSGTMTRLGAESISISERADGSWQEVASFDRYDSGMSKANASMYKSQIYFDGTEGVEYRIVVTVFAEDSSGSDSRIKTFYVTAT